MQFISAASNYTAQMEALIEQHRRLSLSTLIGLVFAHKNFDLLGEESADGSSTTRGKDFGFQHGLSAETYGQVLLGIP
jgi:hypothetical protein